MKTNRFIMLCLTFAVIVLIIVCLNGYNKTYISQQYSLCNSAKISGNKQYLEICECYLEKGEDITCTINK